MKNIFHGPRSVDSGASRAAQVPAAEGSEPTPTKMNLGRGRPAVNLDPCHFATSNTVIVGRRDTGKTYLAAVIVEELLAHNRRVTSLTDKIMVVVFALCGRWFGIRAGRAGSARGGYPVLTIGGEHADIPLNSGMGREIADMLDVVAPCPVLIEMDDLSTTEQQNLVADFAERLNMNQERRPLHVLFDPGDDLFPPNPVKRPQLRAALALDQLVRKRRSRGIGTTMIASRPATLSRNVLSQAERLFVFAMGAPQDLQAIDAFVESPSLSGGKLVFGTKVAKLRKGDAYHVSFGDRFDQNRLMVRRRRTFDSQQIPILGKNNDEPTKLKTISKKTKKIAEIVLFPGTNNSYRKETSNA